MDKYQGKIYDEFAEQLCAWTKTGTTPAAGDQDIRHALSLQKNRLERLHAGMEYTLEKSADNMSRSFDSQYTSDKYTVHLTGKGFKRTADYYLNGKKSLSFQRKDLLYAMITWLNRDDRQETWCCPNCGNISKIEVLLEGCPYCKTRFLMSDLFPKVTNFYFLKDYSMTPSQLKKTSGKWMRIGALIIVVLFLPDIAKGFLSTLKDAGLIGGILLTAFRSALIAGLGALGGYAAYTFSMIGSMLKDSVRQAPMAAGIIKSRKKLTEFMKPYDPGFSFEYFIGQIQSLMKIFIYSDDRSNLAVYEGNPAGGDFDNIIDAQFDGAINVISGGLRGDYCYLALDVYMTDVYCRNERLYQKSEVLQMEICRNIRRPVNYGFSIKKVNCHGCGASFDASRVKQCPYCGNTYALREDDWVITKIRKR